MTSQEVLFFERQMYSRLALWLDVLVTIAVCFAIDLAIKHFTGASIVRVGDILPIVAFFSFLFTIRKPRLEVILYPDRMEIMDMDKRVKVIRFSEIVEHDVRPMSEFKGCRQRYTTFRYWWKKTPRNRGIQLVLTNGEKVFISSQRAEELNAAISPAQGIIQTQPLSSEKGTMTNQTVIFLERQKYNRAVISESILAAIILSFAMPLMTAYFGKSALGFTTIAMAGLAFIILSFLWQRLEIILYPDRMEIADILSVRKPILMSEIVEHDVRHVTEFKGWRRRYTTFSPWRLKAPENKGVQLVLANGKKVFLGSQRAEELDAAIRRAQGQQ